MSSEQLRSGVSVNAYFSSMMGGQATWWRLSKLTRAARARRIRSSTVSKNCTLGSSKTSSTSCGRSSLQELSERNVSLLGSERHLNARQNPLKFLPGIWPTPNPHDLAWLLRGALSPLPCLSADGTRRQAWSLHWRDAHSSLGLDTAIAAPLRLRRAPGWADRRGLSNR